MPCSVVKHAASDKSTKEMEGETRADTSSIFLSFGAFVCSFNGYFSTLSVTLTASRSMAVFILIDQVLGKIPLERANWKMLS